MEDETIPTKIQSRYLLWFNRQKLKNKLSIKKPLIIPQRRINTIITFEISRMSFSNDVRITLSNESKEVLSAHDLKCKCVLYDSLIGLTAQGIGKETREDRYLWSLVEIKVLYTRICKEVSKVNFTEDYIYDGCVKRDRTYFHIPLAPSTELTHFEKRLSDEFVFKFKGSTMSVLYGKYKLPSCFKEYLQVNKKVAFISILKQIQYNYRHLDERFQLYYPSDPKIKVRYDGYLMAFHIRELAEGGELEEEKDKAMECLFENGINYNEIAIFTDREKDRADWSLEQFKVKMDTFLTEKNR